MSSYRVAQLADLRRDDGWAPIRLALDVRAFGVNGWTAEQAGGVVIPEHDEVPTGHEELYLVTAGHATFTVSGDEIDGPAGTIVFVRDPSTLRGAVAREPETTVMTVGARPGEAYTPRAWETSRDVITLFDEGKPDEAKRLLTGALDRYEDTSVLHYNLACANAQLGETGEALDHLRLAIEGRPSFAASAREDSDSDFASICDDPRFGELIGEA
jgi:hypothetical protein